ncbi:hypothetical protein ES707_13362 [subsurface metagenome]
MTLDERIEAEYREVLSPPKFEINEERLEALSTKLPSPGVRFVTPGSMAAVHGIAKHVTALNGHAEIQ